MLAPVAAVAALGPVLARPMFAHPMPGGMPGWWPVFPLLWFALIVTLIVLAFRRRRAWGAAWAARAGIPDPVAVLGERFARGEIDETEYRARLAVLQPDGKKR